MENGPNNRKTQQIVLLVSVAVIIWGLFNLVSGNYDDFFEVSNAYGGAPSSRDMSQAVIFLVAIVTAFFSAKFLLGSKRERN